MNTIGSLSGLAKNPLKRFLLGIWMGLGLLMTACTPATGTLQVNISGLPAGLNASVNVSGPGGFSQALTASTTLGGRAVGSYTVSAVNVSSGGITYVPTITGSPATVAANATATVSVAYVPQTGTLQVNISGLPIGVNAAVSVSGPGFNQNLTATTALEGRAVGSYAVTAANVTNGGITYVGTVTGSPANVALGATAIVSIAYAPKTGTLQINIGGLPSGVNADVSVSGPSFNQKLTATTTLVGRPVGSYSVTAANVSSGGLSYIPTVTDSPANLTENATATVTVTYAINPADLGTLQVNVSGVPSGATGNITVSGPGGFSQNITSTTPLGGLVPGSYTISANDISGAAASNTANFTFKGTVTDSPATVVAGSTSTASVAYQAITGALTLTIASSPAGVSSNGFGVTLTGPNNFSQKLSATTTIPNLAPGTYTMTASNAPVRVGGAIVDAIFLGPAPAEVVVTAGNTATNTTTYTQRGGTGFLWIPIADGVNGAVVGLSADQLASATATENTVVPARSLFFTGGRGQQALLDASGNLYVISSFSASIHRYTSEQLASNTPPTPVTLQSPALPVVARGAAFDALGNLWVASGNGVVAFTSQQLEAGGNQTATRSLSSSLGTVFGLAFDSSGNLWVSNRPGSGLVRFTPQQLATGGIFAPEDLLQVQSASFNDPSGLAFDADGNLWVANFSGNNLLKFTPTQLTEGGSQTPPVVLGGLDGPRGLAFDNGGNLWLTQAFGSVLQIAASDLAASGSPTPAKALKGYGENNIAALAFSPTPPKLPIQNK